MEIGVSRDHQKSHVRLIEGDVLLLGGLFDFFVRFFIYAVRAFVKNGLFRFRICVF